MYSLDCVLTTDNNVVSELRPIEISQVDFSDEHTLVVHPRQYSNIFHVLEGTSVILYLAIHPEKFPNVLISLPPHQ